MTKEKEGKKTVPLKCHSMQFFNNDKGAGFTHLELNISFQIVSNNVWFLGLVGDCVRVCSNKGDGFVVGFGSLSDNVAAGFIDDAPGFASVEDDRIRLNALLTVPMAEENDNPNPAGFVPRPDSEEYGCSF